MIKIAICGAGRMGRHIVNTVNEVEGVKLTGVLERPGHPLVGQDVGLVAGCGALGVNISDNLNEIIAGCDVLIDFTTPKVSLKNLEACGSLWKSVPFHSR